ncbi:hypothetical protein MRB53_034316 [Persea americana]|uniref:Uncharacterized protein n=1 Tax=Persea americana TaxID=3435 RepID=A0ACC2KX94_PERAE|nr:hypothetical protein MRB53_034316 [Persea americana]
MYGFINGEYPMPVKYVLLPDDDSAEKSMGENPEYTSWRCSDRLLRGWITGTLSEGVLNLVVGLETSSEVWAALVDSFAQESQEREFYLLQKLQFHRKGSSTISEYLHIFKNIGDDLSAIGKPLTDRNKVFVLLNGLGPGYESFVTSYLRPPIPTYKEIVPLLQGHEMMRSIHTTESYGGTNQHMAFYGRVYLSRHVVFDEVTYPFRTPGCLFTNASVNGEITTFSEWVTGATNSTSSLEINYCEPQSNTTTPIITPLPRVVDDPNSIGSFDFTTVPATVPELEQSQPVEIESSQPTIVHVNGSNPLQPSNISLDDNTLLFDEHIEETVSLTPPAMSNTNEGSSCEFEHTTALRSPMMTRAQAGITKPNPKYFSSDYALMANNITSESTKLESIPIEPKNGVPNQTRSHPLHPYNPRCIWLQFHQSTALQSSLAFPARNLGDPAIDMISSFAKRAMPGIQFSAPFNTSSRKPSTTTPIASTAVCSPYFPAKSLLDALANATAMQFPKYISGMGGLNMSVKH